MCLGLEKQNYKPFASAQGKSSGHSVLVGEEMMNHLAMYDFKITGKTLALTRIALAATILTSKKSQDGISKLIYKIDLDKMKGKDTTCRLDDMLNAMWPEARKIDKDVGYIAFGRASVHMILHLLGKEKLAKKETFESFTEIGGLSPRAADWTTLFGTTRPPCRCICIQCCRTCCEGLNQLQQQRRCHASE